MACASNIFVLEDTPEKKLGPAPTARRPGVSLFTSPRRQFAPNAPPQMRCTAAESDVVMLSDDEEDEGPSSQAAAARQPAPRPAVDSEKGFGAAKAPYSAATKSKAFGNDFWELARKKRAAAEAPQPATNSNAAVRPGTEDGPGTSLGEPLKGSSQDGTTGGSKKAARQWFVKDADVCDMVGRGRDAHPDAQEQVKPISETVPAHNEIGNAVEKGGALYGRCDAPNVYPEPIDLSDDEEGVGSPVCGTQALAGSPEARGDVTRGLEAQASGLGGGEGLCKARVSLDAALRKCSRAEAEGTFGIGLGPPGRPVPCQSRKQPPVGSRVAGSAAAASGATESNAAAWWESGDVFGGPVSQEEDTGDMECLAGIASTQEQGKEGKAQGGEKRKKKAPLTEEEKGEREVEKAREREEKARKKVEEQEAKKRKREEAKQAKEQAKEQAKVDKRVQKWKDEFGKIKDAVNRNTTYIDSRIPEEAVCALRSQLEERQYPYTVCTNPIPGTIMWRLKVLCEPEQDQSQSQSQSQPQSQPQSQSQALSQEAEDLSQKPSQGRVRPTQGSSQPRECHYGPGPCHVFREHWTPRVRNPATWIGSLCQSQSQTALDHHQQQGADEESQQPQSVQLMDVPYIALFMGPEDLAREVQAGTFHERVRGMQRRVPPTSCLLVFTYGLRRLVEKRDRQASRGRGTWNPPDVGLALARLVTDFEGVHSRECANQYDAALHIAGLHRTLAEAPVRPRLTLFDITKNGGATNKKCPFYEEVRCHPWRGALLRIPGMANRDAVAISREFPTMKSLLMTYLDPELSEKEKEQLLMNMEKPDRFEDCLEESGRARKSRIGQALSARVYQAFTTVGDEKDDSEKPGLEDTCED